MIDWKGAVLLGSASEDDLFDIIPQLHATTNLSTTGSSKLVVNNSFRLQAAMDMDISITRSVTYKRTYNSEWTEEFTFPNGCNVIRVAMTWGYGGDERPRISSRRVSIRNALTDVYWSINRSSDNYIRITSGKKYRWKVKVDGYKGRDYGWILYYGTEFNNHSVDLTDNNYVK